MRPRHAILACLLPSLACLAQTNPPPEQHESMAGMSHDSMKMNAAGMFLMGQASGTSMNPQSATMPMFMPRVGSWSLMLMGQAFLVDTQQSGPRGGDKLYGANWFMASASHDVGKGSFMAELMFSLDPATITSRRYPELFQTGETAYGRPLADAQHPHNFIMGLSLHYSRPVSGGNMFEAYFAPVGDPALGPVAFPHRASAAELPQAPLGHHWQDSTHIAYDVVTVAWKHRIARIEVSGFHGAEPGENRWAIEQGAIDSWSTRLSVFPSRNWMAQASVGRIAHPEHGTGDVVRSTASIHYTRPVAGGGGWSTSLIWGRNHDTFTRRDLNSYLVETVLPLPGRNFLTGRAELVAKDELFSNQPDLEERLDRTYGSTFRIGAYTAGLTHDLPTLIRGVETGVGANVTAYSLPEAIKPSYGEHPWGVSVYLRLRAKPEKK